MAKQCQETEVKRLRGHEVGLFNMEENESLFWTSKCPLSARVRQGKEMKGRVIRAGIDDCHASGVNVVLLRPTNMEDEKTQSSGCKKVVRGIGMSLGNKPLSRNELIGVLIRVSVLHSAENVD